MCAVCGRFLLQLLQIPSKPAPPGSSASSYTLGVVHRLCLCRIPDVSAGSADLWPQFGLVLETTGCCLGKKERFGRQTFQQHRRRYFQENVELACSYCPSPSGESVCICVLNAFILPEPQFLQINQKSVMSFRCSRHRKHLFVI